MIAWSAELWDSIVLITAKDQKGFGTGFVVCTNRQGAWVVTCAHVLEQLKQTDIVLVNNHEAQRVGELHAEIDLAMLHAPSLRDVQPLKLSTTSVPGSGVWIPGWHRVLKETKRRDPLSAKLGNKRDFSETGEIIQRTFDLLIQGFADADAFDLSTREKAIHPGYSGAPVLCPARRAAIGVASIKTGEGEAAYAVSIEHLAAIWPKDGPPLPWLDVGEAVLDAEASQFLAALLGALPQGFSIADLKRHCQKCAPPDLPLDCPAGDDPIAFLYWLSEPRELANRHVPLYDALARLEASPVDKETRQRLRGLRESVAARHPGIDRTQPEAGVSTDLPTGLDIELIAPAAGQRVKRWDLKVGHTIAGDTGSRVVEVREGNDDERLRPDDPEEVAALLDWLLARHVPSDACPARFTFTFRLPRPLIALPVDRWCATDGDPLGIEFPVIVQDADRRAGDVVPVHWKRGWQALCARSEEVFPAPLRWCGDDPSASAQLRTCARLAHGEGSVIALTRPGDPDGESDSGLLNYLLKHLGAPVLLWPRQEVAAEDFRAGLKAALAGHPLSAVAECVVHLRRAREDDPSRPDSAAHFTLLWDPFREPKRPELFGAD